MSDSTASKRYPVLIAGAGPVGLALAIELAYRSIRCLVVEQSDGSVEFPTTNLANTRTVEHLRRWGIADRMRFESGYPTDYPRNYLFVTRMDGYEIARFAHPANGDPASRSPYSPEGRLWISKPYFDPVLHQHVKILPTVEVRYDTSFESFQQDDQKVFAEIVDRETGRRERIEADYLVGCDGGRSNIRRALGIQFQGVFSQGMNVAVLFRSPLLEQTNHGPAVQYQIINSQVNGAIAAVDGKELWRLNIRNVKQEQLDVLNAPEKLRCALGRNIPFELLAVRPWTGHCVVAERYQEGRVFLAGDAAHLNWPAGGFGMNTGVGDAVDVGWKVAAVLEGWGGPKLLDSYTAERKPIAMVNVNEAAEMRASFDSQTPFSPKIEEENEEGKRVREKARAAIMRTRAKEFQHDSVGIELGYRYEDSPICVSDGTFAPPLDHGHYVPSTWPGARAPHVWLRDGRSMLDLFGKGFTLLDLAANLSGTSAFAAAAANVGMPINVVRLQEPRVKQTYERSLVLIRPDGHVAWRGDSVPADAAEIIDVVRGASK
ncbi:MAG TPA: FAD-dependent monooxygenase [Candidatus Binatia bacterium]|jgi:2-polyprenyl-6-methoxyphenol hydroxylase-like FAD-dependent oxidoreductase